MVNLTILIYFVPYLYLFVALVRLRHDPRRRMGPTRDDCLEDRRDSG